MIARGTWQLYVPHALVMAATVALVAVGVALGWAALAAVGVYFVVAVLGR